MRQLHCGEAAADLPLAVEGPAIYVVGLIADRRVNGMWFDISRYNE
jgi:hypothetical protein